MLEQLKAIALEAMEDKNIEITENSRLLADLKLNSLDLVNLVCEVEDEFDVEIPDKKLKSLITIKDVIDFIESQK